MSIQELERKIAKLESIHDQMSTELAYIDQLLKATGFPNGIESAKEVAQEMLQEGISDQQ